MGHSAPKKNILNFALQYDQEKSGNFVSRQPQPHLCLERSFRGDRNLAGNRRQICETERSSLDFRPATSASKVRKLQKWVPPGLQQRTSPISIFKGIFWPLLLKPLAELHVMGQQDPYLPEHPDCSPLSWSVSLPILIQGPFTFTVWSCC